MNIMKRLLVIFFVLIFLLGGIIFFSINEQKKSDLANKAFRMRDNVTPPTATSQQTEAYKVIATGLNVPWALAFLPNGDLLITERIGHIKLLEKDEKTPKSITTLSDVKQIGEGGLHGIAVDPKFSLNSFVYTYYTYSSDGQNTLNRVVRFRFKDNKLDEQTTIVDKIPGALFHDGGRIKFGPDGFLYIATGDAQNPSLSQDKTSLAGKILRVTTEGKAAPDNPFGTLVYSYGHRNPQGLTWDSNGTFWETEHGSSATDEVNRIEKGTNYGWPTITGDATRPGMQSPNLQSGSATWAPAGVAFFDGALFFGGLRGQALFEAKINGNQMELKEHFKGQFGRIREVILGPDNLLYITTSNKDGRGNPQADDDKIIRVNPKTLQ